MKPDYWSKSRIKYLFKIFATSYIEKLSDLYCFVENALKDVVEPR